MIPVCLGSTTFWLTFRIKKKRGKISKIFSLCPLGFLSFVFCTAVLTVRCTAMLIALTLWLSERG